MASRDNQSKQSSNAQKGGQQKQNQQAQKKQTQQQTKTAAPQRTKKQTADDALKQKVRQIQNVVPGWPADDVIRVLKECQGSAEMAIEKMITGDAGHPSEDWQPAKKKKAEKSVKETPKASPSTRNKSGPRGPYENGGQRSGGAGRPDAGRKPSGGAPGSGGFSGPRGAVPQQRVGSGAQPGAQQPYAAAQQAQQHGINAAADGGIAHLQQPSGPSSVDGGLVATPQHPQQSIAPVGVNGQQPTLAQRLAAQQQRARPPVGAPIGGAPRANGPSAQISQQAQPKPPSEQLAAAQQGRPAQTENKPVAQQTTQQPRPQQGGAAPTAAQVAALKPVTAIQPKGPITAQQPAQPAQQPSASSAQPAQAAASQISSQQPVSAVAQPIQTQLQTPLLSSTPSAAQTSAQTPAGTAAATTQQPSSAQQQQQGASTKAYQPFGSSGGKGSGRSRTAASPTQWQPKSQQAPGSSSKTPSSPPQSVLSSPAQQSPPISTSSSAQSITTAKEAPQQAAQQAAAAALGAIGQSVPVILPSGLFPSDREEQSLQLQFGNFGLTPAAPPANVLKEETVVPITPVEPKQQPGPVPVRREEASASSAAAAASAPVSRPSPVSVSSGTTAVSQPSSAQTSAAASRPAAKESKPEPVQSLDANDQSPNLPRKGGNAGGRAGGEKKGAAASSSAAAQHQYHHQQQQQYQQQQYQQYQQQQHIPQRGLAPPAAVPAAMPAAAEGYDMSAFNAAPLPYPAPFWPAYPMDMAPETQQMFYDYQPTAGYRSGAPVSPEPKYGNASSSSQGYRDSGKYAQQAGSQGSDADSGPSPRGSSGQAQQSQSPPPVQPPHHFGVPAGQQYPHVYGYHYPYSYPAASFTQYQYPQRMPTHYKSPHYASTGASYPVSPPDSSSLGASGYPEDDYSKYGMQSQSFYEAPAAHVSPTMGMKNPSLSSSSSKSQQQASQMGAYAQQGSDLSVGASTYKSLGITDYSAQDMSRGSPASSFYSPQFGQQGQYQQQYGFMHHGAHHYQPQQPPHQSQSGQSSGAGQNPQYS